MRKHDKKGFLGISFGWLFALIVGAFILFLAIFFAVQFVNTQGAAQNIVTSKSLGILLDPLETGYEQSKVTYVDLGIETTIENACSDVGEFGEHSIRTSQELFGRESVGVFAASFSNKYIFAEDEISGKEFYIFSQQFSFPFKVSDLIFILPKDQFYCFVNADSEMQQLIFDLGLQTIRNVSSEMQCRANEMSVCFTGGKCDIHVNQNEGYTLKENVRMYFETEALLFASIFSSTELYECQLQRVMKRVAHLAELYSEKKSFLATRECTTIVDVSALQIMAEDFENSEDILLIKEEKESVARINENSRCRLW